MADTAINWPGRTSTADPDGNVPLILANPDGTCRHRHPITRERCAFPAASHPEWGHGNGRVAWPVQRVTEQQRWAAQVHGKNRSARRGDRG